MLKRLTEGIVVVVLVLAAFLAILYLLGLLLPAGSGLRDIMRSGGDGSPAPHGSAATTPSDGRAVPGGPGQWDPIVATLLEVQRAVKDKPPDSILWRSSSTGIPLKDRHAVHTFEQSGASIRFAQGTTLQLGENSLIILKGVEKEQGSSRTRASLVVLEGEIEARLAGGTASLQLDVTSPGGQAQITTGGGTAGTDVLMNVRPGKSSTFSVLRGSAEIEAAGRTVTVGSGERVTLDKTGGLGRTGKMPIAPEPLEPAEGAVISYRNLPPQVEFSWKGTPDETGYRVEIARDSEFRDLVTSRTLSPSGFAHGTLKPGTYHWRVAGVEGEASGEPSRSRQFEVVSDTVPPSLQVEFPEGTVSSEQLLIKGIAEPGARVYVGDEEVTLGPDGAFERTVPLDRGINPITVEAIDAAGNSTYRTRLVNAKY